MTVIQTRITLKNLEIGQETASTQNPASHRTQDSTTTAVTTQLRTAQFWQNMQSGAD